MAEQRSPKQIWTGFFTSLENFSAGIRCPSFLFKARSSPLALRLVWWNNGWHNMGVNCPPFQGLLSFFFFPNFQGKVGSTNIKEQKGTSCIIFSLRSLKLQKDQLKQPKNGPSCVQWNPDCYQSTSKQGENSGSKIISGAWMFYSSLVHPQSGDNLFGKW